VSKSKRIIVERSESSVGAGGGEVPGPGICACLCDGTLTFVACKKWIGGVDLIDLVLVDLYNEVLTRLARPVLPRFTGPVDAERCGRGGRGSEPPCKLKGLFILSFCWFEPSTITIQERESLEKSQTYG
jgi:hypothetical protein